MLSAIHVHTFHVVFWNVTLSSVGKTFEGTYCHCLQAQMIWCDRNRAGGHKLGTVMYTCYIVDFEVILTDSLLMIGHSTLMTMTWHLRWFYCTSHNFIRKWTKHVCWNNNSSYLCLGSALFKSQLVHFPGPPGKCQDSALNMSMTASSHVLCSSLFTIIKLFCASL